MALIDEVLAPILKGTVFNDTLLASQTITITRRSGATGDPDDLSEYGVSPESQTLNCGAPWPYKEQIGAPELYQRDLGIASSQTEVSGLDDNFAFEPRHGMYATLDGQTWLIVGVVPDLDGNTYRLLMRRA